MDSQAIRDALATWFRPSSEAFAVERIRRLAKPYSVVRERREDRDGGILMIVYTAEKPPEGRLGL